MDPGKLADLAAGVFGPDRVRVADRLDDAIELAVGWPTRRPPTAWAAPGCW